MQRVEEGFILPQEQAKVGIRVADFLFHSLGLSHIIPLLNTDIQTFYDQIKQYSLFYTAQTGNLKPNAEQVIALRYLEDSLRKLEHSRETTPLIIGDGSNARIDSVRTHYIWLPENPRETIFRSASYPDQHGIRWRIASIEVDGKHHPPIKIAEDYLESRTINIEPNKSLPLRRSHPVIGYDEYHISSEPPRRFYVVKKSNITDFPTVKQLIRDVSPTSA